MIKCRAPILSAALGMVMSGCSHSAASSPLQFAPTTSELSQITSATSDYRVVHNFSYGNDGSGPGVCQYGEGNLIASGGELFGVTSFGGTYGKGEGQLGGGVLFGTRPDGSRYRILHSFGKGEDGATPCSLIIVKGTIYGTTLSGGTNRRGTLFAISAAGKNYRVLYDFPDNFPTPNDGFSPSGLSEVNGVLLGTTYGGGGGYGCCGGGTVYGFDPSTKKESILHRFTNTPDGAFPESTLLELGGMLYGTTTCGGKYASKACNGNFGNFAPGGTVFRIGATGSGYRILHSFGKGSDGSLPLGRLLYANGALYGATVAGGAHSTGTIFRVTTVGTEQVLYSFPSGVSVKNQGLPPSGLISAKGRLYGTTLAGGTYSNGGTIFTVHMNGTGYAVLHDFGKAPDGFAVGGELAELGGNIYGTAGCGGLYGASDCGDYYGRGGILWQFTP